MRCPPCTMVIPAAEYIEGCYCQSCVEERDRLGVPQHLLVRAIADGKPELAYNILNQASGWSVDERDSVEQSTPLFYAASTGNFELCQRLLSVGANPNATNLWKGTPLHASVDHGHVNIVRLLLTHGAEIDAQTENGDTAAHKAIFRRHDGALALLLAHGADPTLTNNKGKNLTQTAQAICNTEAERLLSAHNPEKIKYQSASAPTRPTRPPTNCHQPRLQPVHVTSSNPAHAPTCPRHNTQTRACMDTVVVQPPVDCVSCSRTSNDYDQSHIHPRPASVSPVSRPGQGCVNLNAMPSYQSAHHVDLPSSLFSYFQPGSRTPVESDCEVTKSLNLQHEDETSLKSTEVTSANGVMPDVPQTRLSPPDSTVSERPPDLPPRRSWLGTFNIPPESTPKQPSPSSNPLSPSAFQFSANSASINGHVTTRRQIKRAQRRTSQSRSRSEADAAGRISGGQRLPSSLSTGILSNFQSLTAANKDSCHTKNLYVLASRT